MKGRIYILSWWDKLFAPMREDDNTFQPVATVLTTNPEREAFAG